MNKFEYIVSRIRAKYVPESKIVQFINKADAAINNYNQLHYRGELSIEVLEQHHCVDLAKFKRELFMIIRDQRSGTSLMTPEEKAFIFDMREFDSI